MDSGPVYDGARAGLAAGLEALGLPQGRVLMLHVRLRGLSEGTGLDYVACARAVLDAVDAFAPQAVLVPAFTYSYAKSRVFHRLFSRAETGRFSEEVRLSHARYRSADPMFSVLDTTGWLESQAGLQWDGAFEPGCLWERLLDRDAAIVNLGIEHVVATQIHYVERLHGATWRSHVAMPGVVYEDEVRFRRVEYDFYARDMACNRLLDWSGIERMLGEAGVLATGQGAGMKLSWFGAQELHAVLGPLAHLTPCPFLL